MSKEALEQAVCQLVVSEESRKKAIMSGILPAPDDIPREDPMKAILESLPPDDMQALQTAIQTANRYYEEHRKETDVLSDAFAQVGKYVQDYMSQRYPPSPLHGRSPECFLPGENRQNPGFVNPKPSPKSSIVKPFLK